MHQSGPASVLRFFHPRAFLQLGGGACGRPGARRVVVGRRSGTHFLQCPAVGAVSDFHCFLSVESRR